MNRLRAAAPCQRRFRTVEGANSRFNVGRRRSVWSLLGPLHYEPNYAYPLVVWLHGPGGDERQLRQVAPHLSMRNYVIAGVRGASPASAEFDGEGFTWRQRAYDVAAAEEAVWDCVEAAGRQYHVHPQRVFLAGFDCGGTMAFRLATRRPERVAGVVSLCGAFPKNDTPLVRFAQTRHVPVLLACGNESRTFGAEEVCRNLRLFHTAGMDVTLRQYPGGQQLSSETLSDVNRWIMERVSGDA